MKEHTSTCFYELDKLIGGGLSAGALYVVGARPAMGKTSFILNLITNILSQETCERNIIFISTKTNPHEIQQKITSIVKSIPIDLINSRNNINSEIESIENNPVLEKISQGRLMVECTTCPKITDITEIIERIESNSIKCDILFIDTLQDFMQMDKPQVLMNKEYFKAMKILKKIAQTLQIPIVLSSEVKDTAEKRKGSHMPLLRDLSGSLEIAKWADVVLFLLRPEYYELIEKSNDYFTVLNIAKNNYGSISSLFLQTELSCLKFNDEKKFYLDKS